MRKRRVLIANGINNLMNNLLIEEPEPPEPSIDEIINNGETDKVEFKSTLRWDMEK